jgi:hypothetical protein
MAQWHAPAYARCRACDHRRTQKIAAETHMSTADSSQRIDAPRSRTPAFALPDTRGRVLHVD